MNFKRHFSSLTEAKAPVILDLSDYTVPSSKSKFKAGDIVLVHIHERWKKHDSPESYFKTMHPKIALSYINEIGTVQLYRNNGYSTKYGVKFKDGNIIPIESTFLIGPFSSFEAAKKYQGKQGHSVDIDPKDMKGFVTNTVGVNKLIEDEFKSSFCNSEVGFNWLEQPIIIKYKKYNVHVLAFKKDTRNLAKDSLNEFVLNFVNSVSYDKLEDNPELPEFKDCFVFFKVINKLTNQLIRTSSFATHGSRVKLSKQGDYYLQQPDFRAWSYLRDAFDNGKAKEDVFDAVMHPVGSDLNKTKQRIINRFKQYDENIVDGFEIFKSIYDIEDKPSVIVGNGRAKDVVIVEEMLGSNMNKIQNCEIQADFCEIHYANNTRTFSPLPKKIKAKELDLKGGVVDNMKGLLNCDISLVVSLRIGAQLNSLEGFPEQINKKDHNIQFYFNNPKNLVGIPDEVYANLTFDHISSYFGAKNCTVFGKIYVRSSTKNLTGFFKEAEHFKSWEITPEDIAKHRQYKDYVERIPELEGLFG
jgi:hypothetical protein